MPCSTSRHLLTWLDSYYGSRDGDEDPRSSFIHLGCEEFYIHDYAESFMCDGSVHPISTMT